MLFLDINYFKDSVHDLSPEESKALRDDTWTFLDKQLKAGTLKEIYWFAGGDGAISIWDFSTSEDLYMTIQASPSHAYLDTEVIPLVDYQGLTRIRKAAAARKAAKK